MITLTRDDDDFAVQLGLVLGSLHRRHDDDCEDLFGGSFSRLEDTSLTWQTRRLDAGVARQAYRLIGRVRAAATAFGSGVAKGVVENRGAA